MATTYEALAAGSPLEAPDIDLLTQNMRHDFYTSFQQSQGNEPAQGCLLTLTASTYAYRWGQEAFRDIWQDAYAQAAPAAHRVLPPTVTHKPVDTEAAARATDRVWDYFRYRLGVCAEKGPLTVEQFNIRLPILGFVMPLRDARQVALGRFGRTPEDHRASLYRNYVLAGQTTRSQAFDTVNTSLRDYHVRGPTGLGLHTLKHVWDEYHDEPFYPPAYVQLQQEQNRLAKVRFRVSSYLGGSVTRAYWKLCMSRMERMHDERHGRGAADL